MLNQKALSPGANPRLAAIHCAVLGIYFRRARDFMNNAGQKEMPDYRNASTSSLLEHVGFLKVLARSLEAGSAALGR